MDWEHDVNQLMFKGKKIKIFLFFWGYLSPGWVTSLVEQEFRFDEKTLLSSRHLCCKIRKPQKSLSPLQNFSKRFQIS